MVMPTGGRSSITNYWLVDKSRITVMDAVGNRDTDTECIGSERGIAASPRVLPAAMGPMHLFL